MYIKSSASASSCSATPSSSPERCSGWLRREDILQRVRNIIVHLRRNHRALVLKSVPPFLRFFAVVVLQSLPAADVHILLHIFLQLLAQIALADIRNVNVIRFRISAGLRQHLVLVRVLGTLVSLVIRRRLRLRMFAVLIEIVIVTFISTASTKLYIFVFGV